MNRHIAILPGVATVLIENMELELVFIRWERQARMQERSRL